VTNLSLPVKSRDVWEVLTTRAQLSGTRSYLIFGDEHYTFLDALDNATRYASALAEVGVERESRVAIMRGNDPEYLWVVLGLALLGAVGVPLNTSARGSQLDYYLNDSDPQLVLVAPELLEQISPQLRQARSVCLFGGTDEERADPDNLSSKAHGALPRAAEKRASFRDLWLLMYTSGTTGPSKAVMCPQSHPLSVGKYVAEGLQLSSDDRLYITQPLFHSAALWWGCLTALWAGATVILAPRFSASQFWDDIERHQATWFMAVMSMVAILNKQEPARLEQENAVHQAFVMPTPEPRDAYERRIGATVTTNYAMTELHPVALLSPDDHVYDKVQTAGRVCDHVQVRIVDDDDIECAPGVEGEIVVRPREPWTMSIGYWGKAEATAESYRNLWFHTGDLGTIDDDGYLFFRGRKKDAIRRRGENISAFEVEEALSGHPGVKTAAVVGVPSEVCEQDVVAFVVRRDDELVEDELLEYAVQNMAYYMVPRYICFIDALPQTESFKIKKFELTELALRQRDQMWDREAVGYHVTRDGIRRRA
jgi:carnitine-CoA ligase